jgi:hypothetical protein
MARREITFSEWMRAIRRAITSPNDLGDLGGSPVDDVARKLGVTKQAVHKMIDTDKLDAIVVTSKAGNTTVVIITQASLDYYLTNRSHRPQGGFSLDLSPSPSEG